MHHGVEITDPAIVAAATLSHRYIADRQLPDKAIDLIDEAASRIRMEIDSKPEAMDRLERRIIQLKIEREALKKEKDEASKKRLRDARGDARRASSKEYADLEEIWKAEKAARAGRRAHQGGARAGAASSSRPRAAPATSRAWPSCSTAGSPSSRSASPPRRPPRTRRRTLLRNKVTEEEIAEVVSKWTGIPGLQDAARARRRSCCAWKRRWRSAWSARTRRVRIVSDAIRRSRAGLSDPQPPERLVPVPRPHRRRQDRALQGARRIPVRHRGRAWCASTCPSSWRSTRWRG